MASRKNKTGITVAGILGGLAIVLITIIVIIQTGVWATVAPQFGLPAITSISQILPGEDSMQKTNIGLGLKKPDLSKIEGQIKDGLASSGNTGEKDSTNTDMGASGLPASAASPMSVSEAITAAPGTSRPKHPIRRATIAPRISGTGRTATSFADTEPPATTFSTVT